MTETATVSQVLREATVELSHCSEHALSEARRLLSWCIEKDASWLIAHDDSRLTTDQLSRLHDALKRRREGEPLAYIIGSEAFWTLTLKVTPDTLIPRPDSEIVVEQALACQKNQPPRHVLDLGTGSGALALSLANEWPSAQVTATDIHPATLDVARENAHENGIQNVTFMLSDWFETLPGQLFDLIVTNPPYIAEADPHLQDLGLQYEPRRALTSGDDGLEDLRRIIADAHNHLCDAGWLLCEHGYDQGPACRALLIQAGFLQVRTQPDYAGNDRVSLGRKPHI